MSNIEIKSGDSVSVSTVSTSTNAITIKEPTVSVTVGGVIADGGDAHYTHTQGVASAEWTVVHNLGKKPAVTVVDSADSYVIGEVVYLNNNSVKLKFSGAFSGKAYFN